LNAVAAFERTDEHSKFVDHEDRIKRNIASRVETLCEEYIKLKAKKHELLQRAIAVA
jgi:hypothetical protein